MVHYLIKFTKGKGIKFISHLDLMRCIERAVRRSGLPVSYSKGFNPHMELSFATPLSVGIWSLGEYMAIGLESRVGESEAVNRLNHVLTDDIRIISAKEIDEKFPSLMSIVDAAPYEVCLVNVPENRLYETDISAFLNQESIEVVKQGKNGPKNVDIKPLIYGLKLARKDGSTVILSMTIASGSKSNLNPELLVEALKSNIDSISGMEINDICKFETYVKNEGAFVTPMEM